MKPNDPTSSYRGRVFATTSWSQVVTAGKQDRPGEAQSALAELCEVYWFPLYAFVRRKGHAREEAEDITQSFFADLLNGQKIQRADSTRGKFRTFLLSMLTNFIANWHRDKNALKRGGGELPFSIDFGAAQERYELQPATESSPEKSFDRSWAMELLASAMSAVESHYHSAGKAQLFETLKPFLGGESEGTLAELAAKMDMSEGAVKVSLHRLRQKYGDQLRLQISKTLQNPNEVDEELSQLFRALSVEG